MIEDDPPREYGRLALDFGGVHLSYPSVSKVRYDQAQAVMKSWHVLLFLFSSTVFSQVTLVSPEEGRRALKELPAAPPAAAKTASRPPASSTPTTGPKRGTILPDTFAGWAGTAARTFGRYSAATLAGDEAPILVEYGYVGAERRQFTKESQTLSVEAVRLKDASGSYGLFTLYRGQDWTTRETGTEQLAWRGTDFLLRKEEVLVRASLQGRSSNARLSVAELRELAAGLETLGGGPLPPLRLYLPERGVLPESRKYILGPVALARLAPEIPAKLVDFEMGAEANLARYQFPGKPPLTLLLLSYPIAQLAASKMKAWQDLPAESSDSVAQQLYARRVGPLVGFVLGATEKSQADQLLNRISYTADVVWNEPVEEVTASDLAQLILNIIALIGALLAFALIAGLGFGFLRALLTQRYPGRFFAEETEIIRLNISH